MGSQTQSRGVIVELTPAELFLGASRGLMRRIQDLGQGRRPVYGAPPLGEWHVDVEGALGEMAVAKAVGCYWTGALGDLRAADVGALQVRTTAHERGSLILHDRDADGDAFVLVVGAAPRYRLAGWIRGRAGKRRDWWRDPQGGRPAYFVPQSALDPISTLPRGDRRE